MQAAAGEAQTMGLPLVTGTKAYWFLARAGGVTAYLLLWFATLWGVLMAGKMTKGVVDPPLAFGLHEFFPTLAMVFAAIHAAVLLGDAYIGFNLIDMLVPFQAPYRTVWTGLGSLAFYLSVALIASFYLKRLVNRKLWRAFHYTAYLAFTLALVHGLMAGTDSTLPAVRWMYILTGASLLFATIYRILAMAKPARAAAPAIRPTRPAAPAGLALATVPVEVRPRRCAGLRNQMAVPRRRGEHVAPAQGVMDTDGRDLPISDP